MLLWPKLVGKIFQSHLRMKKHRTINFINGKLYEKGKKKYIDFPLASEVTSKFLDKLIKINNKNEINFLAIT